MILYNHKGGNAPPIFKGQIMDMNRIKQEAESMDKDALRNAIANMGYTVDARLGEEKLREAYVQAVEKAYEQAVQLNNESSEDVQEPTVDIRFNNFLDPKKDVTFTFNGKKFHMYPGETYNVPVSVMKHLNGSDGRSCMYPDTEPIIDERTGDVKGFTKKFSNRFSAIPV